MSIVRDIPFVKIMKSYGAMESQEKENRGRREWILPVS